ncbi:MAG: hypothetical protein RMJ59_03145 [Candidatus Nitrosocaldus sp.]|nr:hypothetical protein [Candidatus Nitrosocaldus sp.]MCS7141505.1 hypothetical protein [Candidatus Nitrosocaldus sp.]MDW7999711.1 hypothetical protein [Candidatus Nitrosocaldus sp.]MDW8275365.1 hypothetical protein [Candidatus Nitrosocaldus sp.]
MGKVSRFGIYAKGTIVALVMGVPAVASFLVTWRMTNSILTAIIVSLVVYIIAMGFSFKVAKKLAG